MTISLTPRIQFKAPIDAAHITPDAFASKTIEEIAALEAWEGNRKVKLGDLFKIEGEKAEKAEDVAIHISGDLRKARRIGAGMSAGKIIIDGDAGLHVGEGMRGGAITVNGNADSWVGSMMKNGTIEVMGSAGDYVGSSYRGSRQGMKGGTIIIHGNAGSEIGCYMRGGLIKVYGSVAQFAGVHMGKGTIYVQGDSEGRVGAEMTKGKIVMSGYVPSVLPTFTVDSISRRTRVDGEEVQGPFYVFIGDIADNGEGRIYISQNRNLHLKTYEKFIG